MVDTSCAIGIAVVAAIEEEKARQLQNIERSDFIASSRVVAQEEIGNKGGDEIDELLVNKCGFLASVSQSAQSTSASASDIPGLSLEAQGQWELMRRR